MAGAACERGSGSAGETAGAGGLGGAGPAGARGGAGSPDLLVEPFFAERIVRITLARPERGNALTYPMLEALEGAILGLATGGARAAVIAGAGSRSFCTGYDIEALREELKRGPSVLDLDGHPLERTLRAIERSPVPIIAAISGGAYGSGCEIACACDFRIASTSARFAMPPARLGLLYSHTGTARLIGLVGLGATKEMLMTGEPIDAARAERLGLVSRVVEPERLDAAVLELARTLAANAPLSIAGTKELINRFLAPPRLTADELVEIARLREACFRSRDFAEGAEAFLARRPPRFEGH